MMSAVPRSPSGSGSRVTRNDVARLAGVSTAVVSYVVNRSKRVSPDTEQQVRAAIAKLNYRPNPSARALRLGSTEMLGIVVPNSLNPYFAELTHEIEKAASKRGYTLLIANSDSSVANERRHLENLAARHMDGVFLYSTIFEPDLRDLELANIPIVLLNPSMASPHHSSVGVDLAHGAQLAVEHLAEHEYDTIGLIIGTTTSRGEDGREVGWRESLERLALTPGPLVRQPATPEGGYEAMRWLLQTRSVPPALFISSDSAARGVLKAAHEAGIRIPDDLAIVSFDGSFDAAYSWPTLTTVAQPFAEIAETAVQELLNPSEEKKRRVVAAGLVLGASCGCGRVQTSPPSQG